MSYKNRTWYGECMESMQCLGEDQAGISFVAVYMAGRSGGYWWWASSAYGPRCWQVYCVRKFISTLEDALFCQREDVSQGWAMTLIVIRSSLHQGKAVGWHSSSSLITLSTLSAALSKCVCQTGKLNLSCPPPHAHRPIVKLICLETNPANISSLTLEPFI